MSMMPNSLPAPAQAPVNPNFNPANIQVMQPQGGGLPAVPPAGQQPIQQPVYPQQPAFPQQNYQNPPLTQQAPFQAPAYPQQPVYPPAPQAPVAPQQSYPQQPAQPQGPAPSPPQQDFRALLRAQGLNPDGLDDNRLAETFVGLMRGQQAAQNAAAQPPLAPAAAPTAPTGPLKRADVEPFFGLVEKDGESGFVKPKLGVQPEVAQRVNAYLRQQQEIERQLYDDPASYIWQAVEKKVAEVARQQAEAASSYREQVAETAQFVNQNAHWLYAKGQDGQLARDFQGKPVLTPQGQQFMQTAAMAERNGLAPMAQATYALGQLMQQGFYPPPAQQQAQQPQPQAQWQQTMSRDQQLAAFNQQVAGQHRQATNGTAQPHSAGDFGGNPKPMSQVFADLFSSRVQPTVLS